MIAQLDDLEFVTGEGPCLEAFRTDVPVVEPDLAGAGQVIAVITPAVSTMSAGRLWLADCGCGGVRGPVRQVAAIAGSGCR
jgi:hypothetical protein